MFVLYFINNLVLITIYFYYSKTIFTQTLSKQYNFYILFLFIILNSIINLFYSTQINLILTYFCISFLFFKASFTKKGLFISFFLIASLISKITSYVFLTALFNRYNLQNESFIYSLFENTLNQIILITILYLNTKASEIKGMIDSKGFGYFMTFPIISVFIIYTIMYSDLLNLNPILWLLISLGIVIFNIIICTGFTDIIKSKNIQIENEKLKSQELHYLLLEEKLENQKKFIHDFKKHIVAINGYVNNQDMDKLTAYLKDLSLEIEKNDNFILTGNQLIDLSLNAHKNTLISNSINVKYDIKVRDITPISDFDFNIVFSNILENAIESCIRTNGHFIKIKLDEKNEFIILKVINPCLEVNKDLRTLKHNNDYHGYGIQNIIKIVNKYNGSSHFEFDKHHKVFISTIIFNKELF